MVSHCLDAAAVLAKEGIECEVSLLRGIANILRNAEHLYRELHVGSCFDSVYNNLSVQQVKGFSKSKALFTPSINMHHG